MIACDSSTFNFSVLIVKDKPGCTWETEVSQAQERLMDTLVKNNEMYSVSCIAADCASTSQSRYSRLGTKLIMSRGFGDQWRYISFLKDCRSRILTRRRLLIRTALRLIIRASDEIVEATLSLNVSNPPHNMGRWIVAIKMVDEFGLATRYLPLLEPSK